MLLIFLFYFILFFKKKSLYSSTNLLNVWFLDGVWLANMNYLRITKKQQFETMAQ